MAQHGFGNLSSPTSGAALVDSHLEPSFNAIYAGHDGNSRPSYAVAGLIWRDTTTNPWILKIFDGSNDISLGEIDYVANTFKPLGLTALLLSYSNATSGLTATTVQAAIDEVVAAMASSVITTRQIPQNSQSGAYTLVLADGGKHIFHPAADTTARIYTIPANSSVAFPVGTAITFVNQNGTGGIITIAITTDTMRLAGAGTTGSRTLARNGVATALKISSTEWIISGTGLS